MAAPLKTGFGFAPETGYNAAREQRNHERDYWVMSAAQKERILAGCFLPQRSVLIPI
jgi:hypothetical protein